MNTQRALEQAIRNEVKDLKFRGVSEEKARALYAEYDWRYRKELTEKIGNPTVLYIYREGAAIYLQEEFGVEI